MYQIVIIGHVLVGLAVIGLVLIQHGKGADAGAAFGSGSSGTVFGAQGSASFLSRATGVLAAVFFSTSLGLAVMSAHTDNVDIMDVPIEAESDGVPVIEGEERLKENAEPVINVQSIEQKKAQQRIEQSVPAVIDDLEESTELLIKEQATEIKKSEQAAVQKTQQVVDSLPEIIDEVVVP